MVVSNGTPSGAQGDPIHVATDAEVVTPESLARAVAVVEARHVVARMFRRALIGYLIMGAMVVFAFVAVHNESSTRCQDSSINRQAIRQTIKSGDPTLLKLGDPGYSYWSAHKAEASRAHRNIANQLLPFPIINC